MRILSYILLLLLFVLSACGTTEPTTDTEEPETVFHYTDEEDDELDEIYAAELDVTLSSEERLLIRTRSHLSHHYNEAMEVIPEIYLQEIEVDEHADPYAGFRIQLYTTTNVATADSIRDSFVAWADTTIDGYEPDAYVIFRSPNYRVRAGDFQNRQQAIEFSNMIKPFYPDAWVVHERIEPSKVPDESADIRFVEMQRIHPDDMEAPVNDR